MKRSLTHLTTFVTDLHSAVDKATLAQQTHPDGMSAILLSIRCAIGGSGLFFICFKLCIVRLNSVVFILHRIALHSYCVFDFECHCYVLFVQLV
jgi:hypothetical protein